MPVSSSLPPVRKSSITMLQQPVKQNEGNLNPLVKCGTLVPGSAPTHGASQLFVFSKHETARETSTGVKLTRFRLIYWSSMMVLVWCSERVAELASARHRMPSQVARSTHSSGWVEISHQEARAHSARFHWLCGCAASLITVLI